ncbi:M48 family metalloprotease [Streptomyces gamaensis]|uniref:M48 family metalloprotease n=1 Tax=Streptomyces gamaensis TaxID=1763542 RepID=A0ABW0YWK4_9ACTN
MATTLPRTRVDERVMGAGTTVRFALLVVLLLVSCWHVMAGITRSETGADAFDRFGCLLAAGGDPFHGTLAENMVLTHAQQQAVDTCTARYEPQLPWWVALGWPVLLLVVACAVFWLLPVWRTRRGRVVPLAAVDEDGAVRRLVEEYAAVAGLTRVPRVVVDPAAASTGAVVFGSNRRPTVCLHGGLLTRRHTDPEGFRAVLLHELAHIRNGDVTLTYVTVAVWRAFVAVALVPALARDIRNAVTMPEIYRPVEVPTMVREFGFLAFLVVLVYLARSDVLRSREIYADRAAVRWGADPHGWAVTAPEPPRSRRGRALAAFTEVWRTHPRWDLRRESLDDPVVLFGVQALPLLLTGVAATLISSQVAGETSRFDAPGVDELKALLPAAFVVGVAGVALWRGVAHAVLTSRRVPSGVRAGLCLGAGMALGELVVNDVTVFGWLPARPWVLALVVLAGVVVTWWCAECAHVWVRVWRRRTIRPAMLLGLAAMCLVLSAWFAWWQRSGGLYANGYPLDVGEFLEASGTGTVRAQYRSVPAVVLVNLGQVTGEPFVLPAVAALWAVPLLGWAVRPAATAAGWVRDVVRGGGQEGVPVRLLPPLRRVLAAVSAGGVSGWAALAGAMAFLHTRQPPVGELTDLWLLRYLGWILVALTVAAVVAAVVASAWAGRGRLLVALVAAEAAVVVALAGSYVLASADGCVGPLNVVAHSCGWHSAAIWPLLRNVVLGPALLLGVAAAVVAAAVVSVAGRARRRRVRDAAVRPAARSRYAPLVRRLVVGVLCAVAVAATVTARTSSAQDGPGQADPAIVRNPATAREPGPIAADASQTRRIQVLAWHSHGGKELLTRFINATMGFARLLDQGHGEVDASRVRAFCTDFDRIARDADAFFRIPDAQGQAYWKKFVAQLGRTSRTCLQAVDRSDGRLLLQADEELVQTARLGQSASQRLETVARGTGHP